MAKTVVLFTSFILLLRLHVIKSQVVVGEFPQPSTVALNKPILVSSTCGIESPDIFCDYTSNSAASLAPNCISAVCNDSCPYSESSPTPIDLSTAGTLGSGVSNVTVDGPGKSSTALQFSNSFVSITSSNVPQISVNGFTFAAWIKQNTGNSGTLISKANSDGTERTYTISISATSFTLQYHPTTLLSGFTTLSITSGIDLPSNFWHHITVTVYQNDFALYINGTVVNATGLTSAITESSTSVYLGQSAPSIGHYNGLMQDIYFYSQALTKREVTEIVTGSFSSVHLRTDCRCPPSHPVINTVNSDRCIQHTGVTTGRGSAVRINTNSHDVAYMNDNIFVTSWISGINEKEVNVSITLVSGSNSAYELILVFVTYGAPAPRVAILEKSVDGGQSYQPMQYFSDDCSSSFGLINNNPLSSPNDVNCITDYSSQTPLTGNTARVRFLDNSVRPGNLNTPELRDFITADHIQLRMLDFFTNNTTSQHRYYDIAEIIIAARCACNGHAARCTDDLRAVCDCVHNTQGDRCDECQALYNDKPWRAGTINFGYPCKICTCNNHATSCIYNASVDPFPDSYDMGGGGVCMGCLDNTAGQNCDTCLEGFYRPAGVEPSDDTPCTSCGCNSTGSIGTDCVKHEGIAGQIAGQCTCKTNVQGRTCDQCLSGFFNLTSSNTNGCEPCNCNTNGTVGGSTTCNLQTGQCACKLNVEGLKCDRCINGTQGLSASDPNGCTSCTCNPTGSIGSGCDIGTGQCTCKPGVTGISCDRCADGFHSFSETGCQQCTCSNVGSVNNSCNVNTGVCTCLPSFTGDQCADCSVGFFNFSAGCLPCGCNSAGTVAGQTGQCDINTGQCSCKTNVQGRTCDSCMPNFTNLQSSNPSGCSSCDCVLNNTDTSGVLCDPLISQCACQFFASGLRCDSCQDNYYPNENDICLNCGCNNQGSVNTSCNAVSGQCFCKNNMITGRTCNGCLSGHYGFPDCFPCQCNSSGSLDSVCNETTGDCQCKQYVTGQNCDTCISGFQKLQAQNPFGCTKAPEEQSPPVLLSRTSHSIQLSWSPPEQPNGVILLYRVYRNSTLFASEPASITTYNDTGLKPITFYMYQVESVNIVGAKLSEGFLTMTLEAAPEQVNTPVLQVLNATAIQAQWIAPNITNGAIIQYRLSLVAVNNQVLGTPITKFSGFAQSTIVSDLAPFSLNQFVLQACTAAGCTDSQYVSIMSAETAPAFQPAPNVIVINSTSIQVSWEAPSQPNGIITMYEIFQRVSPFSGDGILVQSVSANVRYVVVTGLEPFTAYEFSVISYTSAGSTQSIWVQGTTNEEVPEDIADPTLSVLSSSEIQITWKAPLTPNGVITEYKVFLLYPQSGISISLINNTETGSYVAMELTPYTLYSFYLLVCNSAGCSSSNIVQNTTLESAPQGLSPPTIVNSTGTFVQLSWTAPTQPNGVITRYNVTRMKPSLLSSPLNRDLGVSFYGTNFASFSSSSGPSGFSTSISLFFKTLQPDGILVYSINSGKNDIVAIELRNGVPWFIFDAGSGPAALTLDGNMRFNDGKWHELIATRTGRNGQLTVDATHIANGSSIGVDKFIGEPVMFYIGGLADGSSLTTISGHLNPNATLYGRNYSGCLFGVKVTDVDLDFSSQLNPSIDVGSPSSGCPLNVEPGISFIGGGYLTAPFTPPGSVSFSMSIRFKSKSPSGLLFFAYGNDSYFIVSLKDSDLIVRIKGTNTDEITMSTSGLSLPTQLCNGQWHHLQIFKESDGIIMQVDTQSTSKSFDSLNLITTSDLFVSGVPTNSEAQFTYHDITSDSPDSFSGCIRDFQYNSELIDLASTYSSQKHVRFYGCENTSVITPSCIQMTNYFSTDLATTYTDTTIQPFTEYLYRISAENSAGEVYSGWTWSITGESAPEGIGIVSVTSRTSSTLSATWQRPSEPNGLVIQYGVLATPLNTEGLVSPLGSAVTVSLNIESPDQYLEKTLTGLEPATNYSLVLTAATSIAVSNSGPKVFATTLEDVPIGVQTPSVITPRSTSLEFSISPPTQPNGIIISYRLYIADIVLPVSGLTVIADNLQPFTTYVYHLEACTAVGCRNSSEGTNMTLPAAPVGLAPPTLNELSPTSIQATWAPPTYPNGIILYYELVMLSGQDLSQEMVIFNGSHLQATISQLTPNTVYYFKVKAYNIAGSVSSNSSFVTTPEDIPDQIVPPTVTVINSTSLYVTWQEPLQPNGQIINYTLLQDGVIIFAGLQFYYTVTNLLPFTEYSYATQACTEQGCGTSSPSTARTSEAIPDGYVAPTVTATTAQSATITITEVVHPNGVVYYILVVTGEFLLSNTPSGRLSSVESRTVFNSSIVDDVTITNLIPYSQYEVQLVLTNSAGSLYGEPFNFTTAQAAPELQAPPTLNLFTATSINAVWQPPTYPNGILTSYTLTVTLVFTGSSLTYNYPSNTTDALIDNLTPFTQFTVSVTATNSIGSITSDISNITTGEIAPTDFDQASTLSLTAYSLHISWDPPSTPNGIIVNYTVIIGGVSIATVGADILEYNVTGLYPFTSYNISIMACNSAGCINSPLIVSTTGEAAPEQVPTPVLFATTSGFVIITWSVPGKPNGVILDYTIYKSLLNQPFTSLATVSASSPLIYNDSNVEPYTQYQYYIEATNTAGSTSGDPGIITTAEAVPEGVLEPLLEAISSSSIFITVFPPILPNGIIIEYTITRTPPIAPPVSIQLIVSDPAHYNVTYLDSDLDPFTNYTYTVTACTGAGCRKGPSANELTLEAPPTNIQAPSLILQGDEAIFVAWQHPSQPNGIITSYSIVRADIGYYYDANASIPDCCQDDFSNNNSVNPICHLVAETEPDDTSYINTNLNAYFFYQYCIIATNNAGSVSSDYSTALRTRASLTPIAGPNATATALNSTAIYVSWSPPDVSLLLGPVVEYSLLIGLSGNDTFDTVFTGTDEEYSITGLTPSTTYNVKIQVSNGRGTALGNTISVTTLDGRPLGVLTPVVIPMSATSLLIIFQEPLLPNGDIISYSIFLNSHLTHNQSTPGSYLATGLSPFTLYTVQLEACTSFGCNKSGLISNKTLEAAPVGFASPTVTILGPYSAFVSWTPPSQLNGIITEYNLYLREVISCPLGVIGTCYNTTLITSGLIFNYTVTDLSPATQYRFGVIAINGGGNTSSGFTTDTTEDAPPTSVAPPTLNVLSSTDITAVWQAPEEPNGIITAYYLYRNDTLVFGPSLLLSYTSTLLSPFTIYSFILQACTSGGCTNSSASTAITLEAPPTGFNDPIISNVGAVSLVISWTPPTYPNGLNIYYTVYFSNDTAIVNGTSTSVTITGLRPYTNYSFYVTACNNAGCNFSNIITKQTNESLPQGISFSSVNALSFDMIEIAWTTPTHPNGMILYYVLRRNGQVIFQDNALQYIDTDLEGGVLYTYTIEVVNGAGGTVGQTINVTTPTASPTGISPPVMTVLNSTAILVEWSEPAKANGEIGSYRLFVNNSLVFIGISFSYTLTDLLPFTTYTVRIQVCTTQGDCGSSTSVSNTTNQDIPTGLSPPTATALSSSTVVISWQPPTMPNGVLTFYRIMRRLADNPIIVIFAYAGGPSIFTFTDQGLAPYTRYEYQLVVVNNIGSSSSQWTEVTTFEAAPTGVSTPTFPAIFSNNVTVSWNAPQNPNGIITQYEVYYRVLLGTLNLAATVPGNTTSVVITGLEPFTTYEFRIRAHNSVGTGDSILEVVTTSEAPPAMIGLLTLVTKSSESLTLTWSAPSQPNGIILEYALYLNGEEEYRNIALTYTIDRLKPFTGYSIQLEACNSAGCTRGAIQGFTTSESTPIGQPAPVLNVINSRSIKITWSPPIQENGIIKTYEIFRMQSAVPVAMNDTDGALLIHSTTDVATRVYNDTTLSPNTGYQFAIRANNSVGSSTSAFTYIQTPEAAPESVPAPIVEVLSTSQIRVLWDPPALPNGAITLYEVFRISPGNVISIEYTGLNRGFIDSGLKPYTLYSYFVKACTLAGCTNGTFATNRTDESIPEDFSAPTLNALSKSQISIQWQPPASPNGIISSYLVHITSPVEITIPTQPHILSINVTNLQPFTTYTVTVQACTVVGCVTAGPRVVQTLEATPLFIAAPSVFALGPTSIDASWTSPTQPNGIIIRYILRRNNTVVYDGPGTNFTDTNLLPNHPYLYDVQAFTSVGGGDRSPPSIVTTKSDTPTDVSPPILSALSSTSILVQWSVPGTPNGEIQQYILYRKIAGNETIVYQGTGLGVLVSNLVIFTTYSFRVEACTTTCGSSLYSEATTLEAAPQGQAPPTLQALTNQSVIVTWKAPAAANGIILSFSLQRRQVLSGGLFGSVIDLAPSLSPSTFQYLDQDDQLAPAMTYQYRISVANSKGGDTSNYASVTLPDAPPEGVSAPVLVNKTSTSIALSVSPPVTSNGLITQYILYGTNSIPVTQIPVSQTDVVVFVTLNLKPYTAYTFYADTCTSAGCTSGDSINIITSEDLPTDLLPPVATVSGARSIRLNWTPPVHPNGIITSYSLWFKLPCPQPQVYPDVSPCIESDYQFIQSTTQLTYEFTSVNNNDPKPYTSYQFILQAENSAGAVNSSDSTTVTTLDSAPEVVGSVLFTIYDSNQSIALNWADTFQLNSQLNHFIVIRDGFFLLQGIQTYAVFGNQPTETTLEFSVKAVTTKGEVTTAILPLFISGIGTEPSATVVSTPTLGTMESPSPDTPFYEQPPFIIGMIVLCILILFVCFLLLLCFIRPRNKSEKYDISTLKSQGSPTREDGTVRASWGPLDTRMTPVPSYHEAMANTQAGHSSTRMKSYSPSKVALLSEDYSGGDIPLQDTHIARLSKIDIFYETALGPPPPATDQDNILEVQEPDPKTSLVPDIPQIHKMTPNSSPSLTHSHPSLPHPLIEENPFMDTKITY